MPGRSAKRDDYVLDVSESDIDALATSDNPALLRAVERIFREAADRNDTSTRFNSSI